MRFSYTEKATRHAPNSSLLATFCHRHPERDTLIMHTTESYLKYVKETFAWRLLT